MSSIENNIPFAKSGRAWQRRNKVMDALLTTDTKEDAANLCNITVRQIHRYCADVAFAEEMQNRRNQQTEDGINIVKRECKNIVHKLLEIAYNPIAPFASQISAMRTLLLFMSENDLQEIRNQISQLNRQRTIDQPVEWK